MIILPRAEQIADAILAGCDAVEQYVRTTIANAPGVIDRVLDAVRVGWPISFPLPGDVKRLIRNLIMDALRELAGVVYDALDQFRDLARRVGRPTSLRQAAATLDDQVIAPSMRLDTDMTSAALTAEGHGSWDSLAADPYSTAFAEQKSAVGSVDEVARGLRSALEDLAIAIEEFFDELEFAYISFVVAVAGLALAIVTAVETFGIGAIIGLVVAIAGAVAGIAGIVMAFTGVSSHNAEVLEGLRDTPAVNWPKSVFAT